MATIQTHSDEGDQVYTLRVGAQDPADKSYVVKSSHSDHYVRVTEYTVKDLVEKGRADWLKQSSTPTPEPTTEPGA